MSERRQSQVLVVCAAIFIAMLLVFVFSLKQQQTRIETTIAVNSAHREQQLTGLQVTLTELIENNLAGYRALGCELKLDIPRSPAAVDACWIDQGLTPP